MSRSDWEQQFFKSIFCFYSEELISAAEQLLQDKSDVFLKKTASAELAAFFDVEVFDGEDPYLGTMHEFHRINKSMPYILDAADIPGEDVQKNIVLKVPKSNKDVILYVGAALTFQDYLRVQFDEFVAEAFRQLEVETLEASNERKRVNGEIRDRFAFFNKLSSSADWNFWIIAEAWRAEEFIPLSLGKDPR